MTRRRLIDIAEIVFALAVLLAVTVSLARADDPRGLVLCAAPEPKDVACRLTWSQDSQGYLDTLWYEVRVGLVLCARIDGFWTRNRAGVDVWHHAPMWTNPYKWPVPHDDTHPCWPAEGASVTYTVHACNEYGCSPGTAIDASYTVIGTTPVQVDPIGGLAPWR